MISFALICIGVLIAALIAFDIVTGAIAFFLALAFLFCKAIRWLNRRIP